MLKNCTIENDCLCVSININGKIKDFSLLNKLTGKEIKGEEISELFCVNFKGAVFSKLVKASELSVKEVLEKNDNEKKALELRFSPIKFKGRLLSFVLTYELKNNDHFIRKQLSAYYEEGINAVVDYVDYAPIKAKEGMKTRSLPKQKNSHISGFALSLGQPIFLESAFFGCEFPATYNTVTDGMLCVKYFSGKNISDISKEKGKAVFPLSVIGVADSESDVRLRKALFSYIDTISMPVKLRKQYNSWYDFMQNISAENIETSFKEIEKAMTAVGSKPLDCYVVDDGWNDYQKGFWGFNSKFPNELYPSSELVKSFGSRFGLWLGPRGGYTTETVKFAKRVEKARNGYLNKRSRDVDVGSDKYIRKTKELMLDFEKRFNLTYWKLDGFIQKPCRNKKHDHIVGGFSDMYYYSEVWEKWIDVFSSLHKESEEDVFINLTCYAPPSPWFLQWVNSLWMQISDDMGVTDKGPDGKKLTSSKKDMMLTYRDDKYYDFINDRQFCFPLSNLYNHDPIYANEAKVDMTDEEFRSYLYSMALRGTSFWELYYSYNKMNEEKWRINNDVLLFLEENMSILKNAVMFGGKPSLLQVYGFGSFLENEGIVMLRNPSGKEETYILPLNHSIGAEKSLKDVRAVNILPYSSEGQYGLYSFGDTLKVTLSAYETKVIHFGKKMSLPKVAYVKALNENTAEVMFTKRIVANGICCKENPILKTELLADYRSLKITFEKPFERYNKLTLSSVCDVLLYESECVAEFEYNENSISADGVIKGGYDFTITATTGGNTQGVLYKQGDELELKIENGKAVFRVGNAVLYSKSDVSNAVQISAVRERSSVLKLYVDKKNDSGLYNGFSPYVLEGGEVTAFNKDKVKVYTKALPYDEI